MSSSSSKTACIGATADDIAEVAVVAAIPSSPILLLDAADEDPSSAKPKDRMVRAMEKSLSPCKSCSVAGEGGVGVLLRDALVDQNRLDEVSKDNDGGGRFKDPDRCLPPPTGAGGGGGNWRGVIVDEDVLVVKV
jgi:hypothetical protein